MTNFRSKDFSDNDISDLYKCRKLLLRYIKIVDRYDTLKASLLPRAIRYTRDRVQVTPDDYFTKTMALVADIDSDISGLYAEYRRARMVAYSIIDNVRGATRRVILTEYFAEPDISETGRMSLNTFKTIAKKHGWRKAYVEDVFNGIF